VFALVLALIISALPGAVFAGATPDAGLPDNSRQEACAHIHDEGCGYIEGAPCGHICDEGCVGECGHIHDSACGYIAGAPCGHVCDEDCGTEGLAAEENEGGEAGLSAAVSPFASYDWNSGTPPSGFVSGDTIVLGGAASGTLVVPAGLTISLEGSNATPITLDIGAGATVNSTASIQGSTTTSANTPAQAPMLTLAGPGTFNATGGTISNNGSGAVVSVTGAGATVSLTNATVSSGGSGGYAVAIPAGNVTINVNDGGLITSGASNSNAALTVSNNVTGTGINVNTGGAILSNSGGYAISDGTSFDVGTSNNTTITISGSVTSGTASAIRSSGTGSSVTVNTGGLVSNAAGNNVNPALYMNAASAGTPAPANVIINGGTVQSTSAGGYALQTYGSVTVNSGLVSATGSGRAINLVGSNSLAQIDGGMVQATGSGAAISTATTNPGTVAGASILVTGGTVTSDSGPAVQITGANSAATIDGGTVISKSGSAINTTGSDSTVTVNAGTVSSTSGSAINAATNTGSTPSTSAVNAAIVVNGGTVSSQTGNAINTTAAAANATVSVAGPDSGLDDPAVVYSMTGRAIQTAGANSTIEVSGHSQVYVMTAGNAIRATGGGTVTLYGGFIFAFGANTNNVLNVTPVLEIKAPATGNETLIVTWNQAAGNTLYPAGSGASNNPDLSESGSGTSHDYFWYAYPPAGSGKYGIQYDLPGHRIAAQFFQIADVVVNDDFGLIFNAATGILYINILESTNPGFYGGTGFDAPNKGVLWQSSYTTPAPTTDPSILYLNGFSWATSKPVALTIINGPATIHVSGINTFISYNTPGLSLGLSTRGSGLTLSGEKNGTLVTRGHSSAYGADITFILASASLPAGGPANGPTALNSITAFTIPPNINPIDSYTWWGHANHAPARLGAGKSFLPGPPAKGTTYSWDENHKYVRIVFGPVTFSEASAGGSGGPATGDSFGIAVWTASMILSAVLLIGILYWTGRREPWPKRLSARFIAYKR